jgi:hypothetical protein
MKYVDELKQSEFQGHFLNVLGHVFATHLSAMCQAFVVQLFDNSLKNPRLVVLQMCPGSGNSAKTPWKIIENLYREMGCIIPLKGDASHFNGKARRKNWCRINPPLSKPRREVDRTLNTSKIQQQSTTRSTVV